MGNKILEDMPGEGWVEVEPGPSRELRLALIGADGQIERMWAREKPTPPLPTEPYTVIRATLRGGEEADLLLAASGHWGTAYGHEKIWATAEWIRMQHLITGFKVLAEPHRDRTFEFEDYAEKARHETVKAVLDRVRSYVPDIVSTLDRIGREFKKEET